LVIHSVRSISPYNRVEFKQINVGVSLRKVIIIPASSGGLIPTSLPYFYQ